MTYRPTRIEDYALIGDCETAALVNRAGSIDWLCWPRFDSGACFAALLGTGDHGHWQIAPKDPGYKVERRYRPGTLILETDFECAEGAVRLIDFMPLRGATSDLVRWVIGLRGAVTIRTELVIRFDYGTVVPWVTRIGEGTWRAIGGPDMVVLRTHAPLHGEDHRTVGEFRLRAGESVPFVLSYGPSHQPLPEAVDVREALHSTEFYWRHWSDRCAYRGPWDEAVKRSLITLKALTYRPTGGIVAAPTTSLPECIGGPRNWDYRYCWLRDATFTLLALMDAGYENEARAWHEWLLRAVAGSASQVQIMYGIAGERRLPESELPWLPGYENSRPVRIGNAAHRQLQLDIYGEVMDALHQARHLGLVRSEAGWDVECELLRHLETLWTEPDEGIWEVRGGARHFTLSKVAAWVAFDRAIRSVEEFGMAGPVDRWRALRRMIHEEVCTKGYDPERNTFVQSYGSKALDASLLLLPLMGFLPADDPRIRGTVAAIERELMEDGFVLRYRTEEGRDGLPPGEGAFLACSFWLADNYILQGRLRDAEELYERLLSIRNDVGLLAEEYDPRTGRQLGNFPQAFSHLALVDTAHNFMRLESPARQRAGVAAGKPPAA
ncbi:MAG: glycoside hydrolase family 15 protein [Pseudomonadota bacterium]